MHENIVLIKRCPFCDGMVKHEAYDPYDGYQGNNTVYRVRCRKCGASVTADSYEEVVRKWNSRAAKADTNETSTPVFIERAIKIMNDDYYRAHPEEIPAKEYLKIAHRMLIEDNRAWDNLVVYESNGDYEKALLFAARWSREHPEERREK